MIVVHIFHFQDHRFRNEHASVFTGEHIRHAAADHVIHNRLHVRVFSGVLILRQGIRAREYRLLAVLVIAGRPHKLRLFLRARKPDASRNALFPFHGPGCVLISDGHVIERSVMVYEGFLFAVIEEFCFHHVCSMAYRRIDDHVPAAVQCPVHVHDGKLGILFPPFPGKHLIQVFLRRGHTLGSADALHNSAVLHGEREIMVLIADLAQHMPDPHGDFAVCAFHRLKAHHILPVFLMGIRQTHQGIVL